MENLADEGLEKIPNLDLAQWKFMLSTEKYKNDPQIKNELMKAVTKDSMLSIFLNHFKFNRSFWCSHLVKFSYYNYLSKFFILKFI